MDDAEVERSEPSMMFILLQTIMLILRFIVAQRRRQILRLLASTDVRRLFHFDADDDDEMFTRRQRRVRPDPNRFPKVPSAVGKELMASGDFGSNDVQSSRATDGHMRRKKRLARRILDRELASGGFASQKINQKMIAQVRNVDMKVINEY